MIEYIDTYRDRFGVEAICRTLRQTECGFITSRGYRAAKTRAPSAVATRASMHTDELPLEAFEHALYHTGDLRAEGLVHHSDRGWKYVSIRYSEALAQAGIDPFVGTVGDPYDNALTETVNGLYKTELIYPHRPWASVGEADIATLRWAYWWNNHRLHESLGYITPQEMEDAYYQQSHAHPLGVQ